MSKRYQELLLGRQKELSTKLQVARAVVTHAGEKGTASELKWKEMLGDFLPRRYCLNKAFVIDSQGNESDQIDVVIYDQHYSPLIFREGDCLFIPAESVYAVFESKQELTAQEIDYAGKKAASVRRLHRTSADIRWAGGMLDAQEPGEILAGILTTASAWSPPLGKPFEKAIKLLSALEQLDLGCVAISGAFDIEYSDGMPSTIHRSQNDETTLSFFLLRLFVRLQQLATVRAIDMDAYMGELPSWPKPAE